MLGRILVAVEEVLGVVDHFTPIGDEMGHSVGNHRAVFLYGGAQDFGHLHLPALAEDGHHRRFSLKQQFDLLVLGHRGVSASG